MPIANRLKQFLDYKDVNYREADELFGFSNGLTGKFVAGKTNLGVDKIENILSACPELNGDWLLKGRGDMIVEDSFDYAVRDEKPRYNGQSQRQSVPSKIIEEYEAKLQDKDQLIAALKETVDLYRQLSKK